MEEVHKPVITERAPLTERARRWASTMRGHGSESPIRLAHHNSAAEVGELSLLTRTDREALEALELAPGATRSEGAGVRCLEEEADPIRTCFERDRDRILHSAAFRRLAGKTQVFVFPDDHQRTRLTHALEVTQVAAAVARTTRLNVALTEAIALGHDCGHGPGGHASEDALSPYLTDGFDHAQWGADVVLDSLNLCTQTLDGIRNHSWSRPAPSTPEGEVVSWADRIAYTCHDLEDAVQAGVVTYSMLPKQVIKLCGSSRSAQLSAFIEGMVDAIAITGQVAMTEPMADALSQLRAFNYEHIYLREASVAQGAAVIDLLQALVEHYLNHPEKLGLNPAALPLSNDPSQSNDLAHHVVAYVAGMTDRFACQQAIDLLDWPIGRLPHGFDIQPIS